ncbi:APC family permease [Caulobacter sp. S45]|uniref:APC family permease n=1 Tax=Caulobacter sp. S45 TaxID=1641861 RepID=UPI00131DEC36|nr:APC family permease [Caulobacter sp. S45]
MPRRRMRFLDLVLFTLATSVSIRWLPAAAAAGPVSLLLWAAAMLGFMVPLVVATAELATRFQGEGGLYVWARETLGPFAGFLCGWLYWTSNLPFFSGLVVFILNAFAMAGGPHVQAFMEQPAVFLAGSVSLVVVVTGLHLLGLGAGKWASNLGTVAMFGLLGVLVAAGVFQAVSHGPATNFHHASWRPPLDANGAILWSTMVFAFGGPEALAFLRNEIDGGIKRIVRILAWVGALQVVAYGLGTLAMLSIMTPGENSRLSGIPQALQRGLGDLGLARVAPMALLLLGIAFLGGFSAWFGVAARLPFAAGVDAFLPKAFARRDPKTGAPVVSIIAQAAATILLVVISQAGVNLKAAYDFLVSMSVLSYTIPFLFLFVIYMRAQRRPLQADGWGPPGGAPVAMALGGVGLVVTASAILCTLVPSPDAVDKVGAVIKLILSSGVLVAAGVVAYAAAAWKRRPAPQIG